MNISYHGAMDKEPDCVSSFDLGFGVDLAKAARVFNDVPMPDDEIVTSVMVAGTTFTAVYGVVDGVVELISPDLGEGRAVLAGRPADRIAKNLLRRMAREEVLRTEIPFMPDRLLVPKKPILKRELSPVSKKAQADT